MGVGQHHEILPAVGHIAQGRGPRRLHQQRDGAEFFQGKEAGMRRARLYGKRRLELQHIEEIGG